MNRKLFLQGIGIIFTFAFVSCFIQYRGLNGQDGILPSRNFLIRLSERNQINLRHINAKQTWQLFNDAPTLSWFYPKVSQLMPHCSFSIDEFHDMMIIVGVLTSLLIAFGFDSTILFVLVYALYQSMVVIGQDFYSFQWDILLLETSFLCVLYARWPFESVENVERRSSIVSWLFMMLFFKLMFLSGIVKIQSNCPTWMQLTALEFHYATQCLPTFVSWYFHQLHPLFHRFSVAYTLVIEIAGIFLSISPLYYHRMIGALLQSLLQMMIMLTGNYTYFNLLTLILLIPSLQQCFEWSRKYYALQILSALFFLVVSFFHFIEVQNLQLPSESKFAIYNCASVCYVS
jgi:hypothetical protein